MTEPCRLLILGLGNVLCGDDGLGVAAVEVLARSHRVPEGVRILDGGTLGLALLPYLEDAEAALLVDAIRADAPPGAPIRLAGEDVAPAVLERLSPHQIGVADLLAGARLRGRSPRRLVLLGLVPETLELGLGRSAAVEAGLPALVERIVLEARALGHELAPKAHDEVACTGSNHDVARMLGV
jgi:hydrogenase maturation protease